jgi:hypothetical protein
MHFSRHCHPAMIWIPSASACALQSGGCTCENSPCEHSCPDCPMLGNPFNHPVCMSLAHEGPFRTSHEMPAPFNLHSHRPKTGRAPVMGNDHPLAS